ncbi:multidrug resistance protein (multidrug-ef flux transporter) [Desulfosporosinus sp. I2]|uniref:MFS transporter n=1 Tax=Desulfosporosinus sp. I2 TaxID=1617025 RepID=UPI0005EF42F8|nr:MFS transporter [Desulfosporosinus sp. I2]KJR46248.1 multidrug resistance protein (multidrug-ef flux transporter) [Desulfosporosinus sp. I2]
MTVKVFQNRSFVLYILGSTITLIGDQALTIALALYMLKLTGSAAQFATVIAIGAFPTMVFGTIAGSLADRFDKKIIIIGLDIFRGVLLTVIFLKTFISQPSEIEIYFVVLIISICESFYIPADASIIPNILDEDALIQGNTISSMTTQISLVVAPAVAAMIYGILGISFIFLLDAITFLIIACSYGICRIETSKKYK